MLITLLQSKKKMLFQAIRCNHILPIYRLCVRNANGFFQRLPLDLYMSVSNLLGILDVDGIFKETRGRGDLNIIHNGCDYSSIRFNPEFRQVTPSTIEKYLGGQHSLRELSLNVNLNVENLKSGL
ncbi:MAG: hypothetical protein GY714_27050 [Desulfobacterales bacterium]|nr:hypothetical protein [Desulfobacterales bacterium]